MSKHWQWKRLFASTWDSEDIGAFTISLNGCLQPTHFYVEFSLMVLGRQVSFGVVEV